VSTTSADVRRRPFRFGAIVNTTAETAGWAEICRRVEDAGCTTVYVSDHFGDQFALIPALAAALNASTTVRAGALVACNDYRHPVTYAKELATLDVLSNGRVDWGIGAGWLDREYHQVGIQFDHGSVRAARLREAVTIMKGLFADGAFSFSGAHYSVRDLDGRPKPTQRPHPPLTIGAQGKHLLSFAARQADVISVAPSLSCRQLGAIPPRQSVENAVDEQIRWICEAAADRLPTIELNMVASPLAVTRDRSAAAESIAPNIGMTPAEALRAPHAWLGTTAELCDKLQQHRDRWGISSWAVNLTSLPVVASVIERLAGK
jgi:probable F420-dependent oxidoreductase